MRWGKHPFDGRGTQNSRPSLCRRQNRAGQTPAPSTPSTPESARKARQTPTLSRHPPIVPPIHATSVQTRAKRENVRGGHSVDRCGHAKLRLPRPLQPGRPAAKPGGNCALNSPDVTKRNNAPVSITAALKTHSRGGDHRRQPSISTGRFSTFNNGSMNATLNDRPRSNRAKRPQTLPMHRRVQGDSIHHQRPATPQPAKPRGLITTRQNVKGHDSTDLMERGKGVR